MRKFLCVIFAIILVVNISCTSFAANNSSQGAVVFSGNILNSYEVQPIVEVESCPENINQEASAVYMGEMSPTEFASMLEMSSSPYAYTRIEFSGCTGGNIVTNQAEYLINPADNDKLHIDTCVWAPEEYSITIGFWNMSTGALYGIAFSGGSISNYNITTQNMPSGRYWVYVKNNQSTTITTGYLRYNII